VLILSLDTTTRGGSAAVLQDDRVLALVEGDGTRTHAERLPAELERALVEAGHPLAAVELLAVASGPGAFTGLRIGMSAMQGLALVTGRPVVGVSALDALALTTFERLGLARARIGCWTDAARGEVFAALYDVEEGTGVGPVLTAVTPPEAGLPEQIWSSWQRSESLPGVMAGDAAIRYRAHLTGVPDVLSHPLLAPAIARLGRRQAQVGGPHVPHLLQPLYVRRPDVERPKPPSSTPP
jgi:tRNA threonylcarbamoyladenosine biosynthesis protein TsaB